MTKDLKKDTVERNIFIRFVKASSLPVTVESVQSRCPPEPDIICRIEDEGMVRFELVQIIDNSFAKRTDAQLEVRHHIETTYNRLPPNDKSLLSKTIGNALISIDFKNVPLKKKKGIAGNLLVFLKSVDPAFEGDLSLKEDLKAVARRITIFRADFIGPCFDVVSVGSLGDPIVERLQDKFSKSYKTNDPIELLAYYDLQPLLNEKYWVAKIDNFVKDNIKSFSFRRVWVFDIHKKRIIYKHSCNKNEGA